MRAYTHPIGGVLYIGVAWGGLFIIEMGVWRCLFDYKLSDVPRFRVFITLKIELLTANLGDTGGTQNTFYYEKISVFNFNGAPFCRNSY